MILHLINNKIIFFRYLNNIKNSYKRFYGMMG